MVCFQGIGINFSNLTHSASYPLVFGGDAAAQDTPASEARYQLYYEQKEFYFFPTYTNTDESQQLLSRIFRFKKDCRKDNCVCGQ